MGEETIKNEIIPKRINLKNFFNSAIAKTENKQTA